MRHRTFASFSERNYALFFAGQVLSLTGSWTEKPALQALVYEITHHDARWLGWIGAIPLFPTLLVSLPAGALVDRANPRRVVIVTQLLMMLGAAAMATLVRFGTVTAWHVLAYSVWSSGVFAVDAAARQALVVRLVPRERLTNAIALNTSMFSVARFAGGIVFALIISYTDLGKGGCIALNAISFAFVIVGLLLMRLPPEPPAPPRGGSHLWEGVDYARRAPTVRAALLVVIALSMFGFQISHLLPVFAEKVWAVGEPGLGYLNAAAGIGALAGSLALATRAADVHRGRLMLRYCLAAPVFLCLFAAGFPFALGMVVLAAGGFVMTQTQSCANSLIQHDVPDALRGRVMSLYTLSVLASFPVGALFAGYVADRWGAPVTTLADAVVILAVVAAIRITHPALRETR
jgi:MFS family permease